MASEYEEPATLMSGFWPSGVARNSATRWKNEGAQRAPIGITHQKYWPTGQKKIAKNVSFLQIIRPTNTSPYRATADAIIQQYQSWEITNLKTALNFVLKLRSERPETSAKKFNDYIQSNEVKVAKRSALDAGLDFEPGAITINKNTLRSTPQQKQIMKKLFTIKLDENFIRDKIRRHKKRKMHTFLT